MDYGYDAVPVEDLPEIPIGAHKAAIEKLTSILEDRTFSDHELRGGFIYDRKGYVATDGFGKTRNLSYGRPSDDAILQITIRVKGALLSEFAKLAVEAEGKQEKDRLDYERGLLEIEKLALEEKIAELDKKLTKFDA